MGRLADKIFETISAGLVYLNADFKIVEYNLHGLRAIGADETADLTGKHFFDILKNHSAGLRIAFQKVLSEQKQRIFWGYPVTSGGKSRKTYWDYTISNLDDGLLLSAVEVTDRVNTERGLQDSIENTRQAADKFRAVIEQMSDGVIVCDGKGKIVNINDAAEKMLGEAVMSFILEHGKEHSDLIKKTDGEKFLAKDYPWVIACAQGEQSSNVEMLVRQGDETSAVISVNASPLFDKNGVKIGAVAVLRDVTENRHLIAELRKANFQLEEYNRLKAEFVANMSHELRTPLTAIIGFAQLMQMKSKNSGNFQEEIKDGLERILRNGRHLLTLIDEVLDLSKIEAGRLTLHLEHFDLAEMIEKTFGGLESLAVEKGLQYNLKVVKNAPLVFSDPARIRQILLNLLSNAIKFTQTGGVQVILNADNDEQWSVSVKDSGLGIKAENLESIFERFRQVDGSFTRTAGGFGLGLSISQQLAALLGGKITVESDYGEGSTFTLTLPYTAPTAATILNTRGKMEVEVSLPNLGHGKHAENSDLIDKNDGRQTILVIDDLPDSTQLLTDTLHSAGYRVVTAHSGSEGILMARKINPDAITLDIMMPGMDGWRVLQEMKADAELAKIPVIVVSIVDNKPLAYRLGASNYLVKPVAPENLLQTLNTVVDSANETDTDYVLVVDDELGVRELLISALKQGGFKTFSASSGEIALAQAAKRPPLAILTDLHMPGGMTGYELIARLRSQPPTSQIPIIVITGKDLMAEDRHFISGQIADVIRKGDLMLSDLGSRLRESLAEIGVQPTNGKNNVD
jgi:PAS domain S-box-containing protein